MAYFVSSCRAFMHFEWGQHLELSKEVANASDRQMGISLALMCVAITLLMQDLLAHELQNRS